MEYTKIGDFYPGGLNYPGDEPEKEWNIMGVQIVLTPAAWLLINLMMQNAIAAIFNQVASMTPEEIDAATPVEQARNRNLIGEVESH